VWLSSTEIHRRHAHAIVAQLTGNHGARFQIERALVLCKGFRRWAAGDGCLPTRHLLIALLGIGMPETVKLLHPDVSQLPLVAIQLLDVVQICWDQSAAFGECFDLGQEAALLVVSDRHRSG